MDFDKGTIDKLLPFYKQCLSVYLSCLALAYFQSLIDQKENLMVYQELVRFNVLTVKLPALVE